MRYSDPYLPGVPERTASAFFFVSLAILALNCVSQILAFPFQCALIIYAVVKCDIKLFPGMFLLMLDKSDFPPLQAQVIKFNLGFSVSPTNVFLITVFFFSLISVVRRVYDGRTLAWFLPWLTCIVPALAMALPARSQGLASVWQTPIIQFMTPAVYFWGICVGRTWEHGKRFFVDKMVLVLAVLNILELFSVFHIFTFAEHVTMLALLAGCLILRSGLGTKVLALIGGLFAVANVLLGRYMNMLEDKGYATSAEMGSTFTRVMVVVLGVMMIRLFWRKQVQRTIIRLIPYIALVGCLCVFVYAVGRARSMNMSDAVENKYQTWLERFEFKLVGDRGSLWSTSLDYVFEKPLFFRDLMNQMVLTPNPQVGQMELGMRVLPHNQVLTLLVRDGWWLGLVMVFFLWWSHIRTFNAASDMVDDKALLCTLLAPYGAIFIAVGLTGQSVLFYIFCGNGMVTLAYPGIIYGALSWRKSGGNM